MKRYEYSTLSLDHWNDIEKLNELGRNGWRVVTSNTFQGNFKAWTSFLLERKLKGA